MTPAGRRLVLVEDEADLRTTLATVLESLGWDVRSMATLAECRAVLAEAPTDAVVLDHHVSDGFGADLAAEIRAAEGEIPVVLISGDPMLVPPDGVTLVAKPFRLGDLVAALAE